MLFEAQCSRSIKVAHFHVAQMCHPLFFLCLVLNVSHSTWFSERWTRNWWFFLIFSGCMCEREHFLPYPPKPDLYMLAPIHIIHHNYSMFFPTLFVIAHYLRGHSGEYLLRMYLNSIPTFQMWVCLNTPLGSPTKPSNQKVSIL